MPETRADDAVVIERTFPVAVATVWSMWTNPDHFAAWYGPDGATVEVADMDVRPGGRRRIAMAMNTPQGVHQMWFAGEHRVVEPDQRLVYTEVMVDADGNETSPTTVVEVDLQEVDGGTRMVMAHRGIPADSPGATGWNMAFDELARILDAP